MDTTTPTHSNPIVPVFVIHWESPERCALTIASIAASERVDPIVHVIENSADGGLALRRQHSSDVTFVVPGENTGFAGGANIAFAHWFSEFGNAPFAVVACHDARVEALTLRRLIDAMEAEPELGVVGPQFRNLHPRGTWDGTRARSAPAVDDSDIVESDWINGGFLLIRKDAAVATGGFESRFGSYVEDVDFCLRVRDQGWKVAVIRSALADEAGSTSKNVTYLVDRNSIYLAAKRAGWRGAATSMLRLGWFIPRGLVAAILPVRRPLSRRISSLRHVADHLRALIAVVGRPRLLLSLIHDSSSGERLSPQPQTQHDHEGREK